jgi:hypothetical protein
LKKQKSEGKKNILIMVLKAQNFQFSTNVALAYNVIGLGAVVCRLVRWENCAKPVLYAGAVI